MASSQSRNHWLDALRGIAIGQVIVWHLIEPGLEKRLPLAGRIFSATWSGVDLFFVLSGFLIGGILLKNRGAENYYTVFYARRMLRIIPLYVVALCVAVLGYGTAFQGYYLIFGQNVVWAAQDMFGPGPTAMTWSLAVEEQFYLCLPIMVALIPARSLPKVIIALILAAPAFRIVCHWFGYPHAAYLLLPARMDSLFIGVLIAWVAHEGRLQDLRRVAGVLIWPLGFAFAVLTILNLSELGLIMGTLGYTLIASFYGCALAIVASERRDLPTILKPCMWMGLGAYSLYLFHTMLGLTVISMLGVNLAAAVGFVVVAGGIAFTFWKVVEAPLINYSHRRFLYRRSELALEPAIQ